MPGALVNVEEAGPNKTDLIENEVRRSGKGAQFEPSPKPRYMVVPDALQAEVTEDFEASLHPRIHSRGFNEEAGAERRVPVVDREAGIAVAFVFFNAALPDLHMFKFRSGHVELIQSVIGPRGATSTGWPDDKTLSRRIPPPDEKRAPPLGPQPNAAPATTSR